MASRKDMRREDLIVPYVAPENSRDTSEFAGTMSSTLPMAAMFTRNKVIGWTGVLFAVQNFLSESGPVKGGGAPAIIGLVMSFLSLGITYMGLFLPPPPGPQNTGSGTGTEVPPAAPLP